MAIQENSDSTEMMNEQMRMMQLAQQGFHCSDIIVSIGLEAQGKTDPDLVRTVSALAGGLGFTGEICGALTGGICLLGLHAGKGAATEEEDPRLALMADELVDWFSSEQSERYQGIRCSDITEDDPRKPEERCPRIVWGVFDKAKTLLAEHGFDWKEGKPLSQSDETPSEKGCACTGATGNRNVELSGPLCSLSSPVQ
jgi:C_GCAxxG_C_C family probable redox protein